MTKIFNNTKEADKFIQKNLQNKNFDMSFYPNSEKVKITYKK